MVLALGLVRSVCTTVSLSGEASWATTSKLTPGHDDARLESLYDRLFGP